MSDRLHDVEPRDAMPDKAHMITALALNVERKRVERLRHAITILADALHAETLKRSAHAPHPLGYDGLGLQPGDLTEGEA